eukprot:4443778-Alexandrium_andersonii.AAC.1
MKTGCLDPDLRMLRRCARMVLTDTHALEGINSMVKRTVKLAPNMRLGLLSSRVVAEKTLADKTQS